MASIEGSVSISGFIAPTDDTDVYAVTSEEYNKGGYRTVADTTERDAITTDRRKLGMIVYSVTDDKYYTLKTGLTNSDWIETYYKPVVTLVDGATITPDFAEGYAHQVTIEGDRLLDNPSNLEEGQSGIIYIIQGTGGNHLLIYGNKYAFPSMTAPTLSTTEGALDALVYYVKDVNTIVSNVLLNVGILV